MSNGKFPVLVFANSGWCEKLGSSYFKGRFEPRTKEQYEALKPFAVEESGGAKALENKEVKDLREVAKSLNIKNYAKKKKPDLIEAINEARNAPAEEAEEAEEEADAPAGDSVEDQEESIEVEGE